MVNFCWYFVCCCWYTLTWHWAGHIPANTSQYQTYQGNSSLVLWNWNMINRFIFKIFYYHNSNLIHNVFNSKHSTLKILPWFHPWSNFEGIVSFLSLRMIHKAKTFDQLLWRPTVISSEGRNKIIWLLMEIPHCIVELQYEEWR